MKRIVLIAGLLLLSAGAFAQDITLDGEMGDPTRSFKHEVKLNLASTIFGLCPEAAYEYRLNENMAVGGRLSWALQEDNLWGSTYHFLASPYFRWYFPYLLSWWNTMDPVASGFFLEVNAGVGAGRSLEVSYPGAAKARSAESTILGLGLGGGYRLVMRRGWSAEVFSVIGRDLMDISAKQGYATVGLTIGYTF